MNAETKPADSPFDYGTMTQLPRQKVADAAWTALDALQKLSPEEQLAGAALLFAVMCKRTGVDPHDIHEMALRVYRPDPLHRRANASLEALRDYVGLRVKGDRGVSIS